MYTLTIKNITDQNQYPIEVLRIEYAIALGQVGTMNVRVDGSYPANLFSRDMMGILTRRAMDNSWTLIGKTAWFLRKAVYTIEESDVYWTLSFESALGLLARRLVAYNRETTYADKTAEEGNDGPADDLMKEYVRENLGGDAVDTDRDLSDYLVVDADLSAGEDAESQSSFRDVLSSVRDLANQSAALGTEIYFDIFYIGQKLVFRTFTDQLGVDRTLGSGTIPVIFSDSGGDLEAPVTMELDWSDEKTYCYVGGYGNGAGRIVEEVEDATRIGINPFNRIEIFRDERDYDETTYLQKQGELELKNRTPKLRVQAQALETPTKRFGIDFDYGDKVSVSVRDRTVDCNVQSVNGSFEAGEETLRIVLSGETEI